MHKDINVNVSGPVQPTSTYKTIVLKGNHSFASQVTEPNTKYVIKHNFDLSDGAIVYEGWEIEGMGGNPSIIDGEEYWLSDYESGIAEPTTYTLVDDECFFVIDNHISEVKEVTLQYEESAWIATKRRGYHARILSHLDPNAAITIPEGCLLEFDGGSISGQHTLTGNNTRINAGLVKIFNTNVTLAGTWNVAEAYPEWFGAKGDGINDDSVAFQKIFNTRIKTVRLQNCTYLINHQIILNAKQHLIGCGYENTVILCDSIQEDYALIVGDYVTIKDLSLRTNNYVQDEVGSSCTFEAIYTVSSVYCQFVNLRIVGFSVAVRLQNWCHELHHVYIEYCDTGIHGSGAFNAINIRNTVVVYCNRGFLIGQGQNVNIVECTIENNNYGIWIQTVNLIKIQNCYIENNITNAIYINYIDDGGSAIISGNSFLQSPSYSQELISYNLDSTQLLIVENNRFANIQGDDTPNSGIVMKNRGSDAYLPLFINNKLLNGWSVGGDVIEPATKRDLYTEPFSTGGKIYKGEELYDLDAGIYAVVATQGSLPDVYGMLKVYVDNDWYSHAVFVRDITCETYIRTFDKKNSQYTSEWKQIAFIQTNS